MTYFSYIKIFKTWFATYYKFNKMHDDLIMIQEKIFNLIFYIYIKINKGLQCWEYFLNLVLHACSPKPYWEIPSLTFGKSIQLFSKYQIE